MICTAAVAALLLIGAGASQETRESKYTADRHGGRGMACGACHGGEAAPKAAAQPESCLACKTHESLDAVAERTDYGKGYSFNPHRNHLLERNKLACAQCHQAHKADTVVCYDCHNTMKFK